MSTTKPPSREPQSAKPQSREIYRMRAPVIVWWAWLAFAVINTIDLAIQWHHRSALMYGAFLAVGTGVAYACALRPRLIADDAGITIANRSVTARCPGPPSGPSTSARRSRFITRSPTAPRR